MLLLLLLLLLLLRLGRAEHWILVTLVGHIEGMLAHPPPPTVSVSSVDEAFDPLHVAVTCGGVDDGMTCVQ
jgi:hypothetical protein